MDSRGRLGGDISTCARRKPSDLDSDGTTVHYRATRDGQAGLYRAVARRGATEEFLLEIDGVGTPNDVSPDGQTLLYFIDSPQTTGDDICSFRSTGRIALRVFSSELRVKSGPVGFHPTAAGLWSGPQTTIDVVPYPAGAPATSIALGDAPLWSKDGKSIFFRQGKAWLRCDLTFSPTLTASEPEVVVEGHYLNVNGYDFAVDEEGESDRFLFFHSALPEIREIRVAHGLLPAAR